ncbi:phosphoribosylglycinamide formyltransferase [Limnochorda pilosa]|uniref:Phosphoribosylglycinamide formyltransferase n=2 Tax=Limnochorda pilosa TaxID=1555112 RepID=A0A0K2SJX8_LIMPI|nr:phosphoribosylglycinamide formyltransferase [Limnochorda pilosa]
MTLEAGPRPVPLAVFVSGRGSNLRSILEAQARGDLGAEVALVLSDRPEAPALEIARAAGAATWSRPWPGREGRDAFFEEADGALGAAGCRLICLAGFMRLLPAWLVRRHPNRILNIHPSLLPAFPGKDAQAQALAYGVKVTGCTVHLVDEQVDHGPILLQRAVEVHEGATVEELSQRILEEEHRLYPEAIRLYVRGGFRLTGRRVIRAGGEATKEA